MSLGSCQFFDSLVNAPIGKTSNPFVGKILSRTLVMVGTKVAGASKNEQDKGLYSDSSNLTETAVLFSSHLQTGICKKK